MNIFHFQQMELHMTFAYFLYLSLSLTLFQCESVTKKLLQHLSLITFFKIFIYLFLIRG